MTLTLEERGRTLFIEQPPLDKAQLGKSDTWLSDVNQQLSIARQFVQIEKARISQKFGGFAIIAAGYPCKR